MKLKQLLRGLEGLEVRGSREVEIHGLSSDSRTVAPGDLFIARKGEKYDGSLFIAQAIRTGAVAVVTDLYDPFLDQTQIICPEPGKWEALLAARFYQNPSQELFCVGVTGSKGKTTTSYLVHHLLQGLGKSAGLMSTIETVVGEERFFSSLTTHEPIYNQKMLREMITRGCQAAVLEVSSIGLDLGRTEQIDFAIGIFTNLYPDHLDYHKSVEHYALAKKKLTTQVKEKIIVNQDSDWTTSLLEGVKLDRLSFGVQTSADLMAKDPIFSAQGTQLELCFQNQKAHLHTPLMGLHNIYNLLAAAAVGIHLGASLDTICQILSSFQSVPGRLERVVNDRGIAVFVDYAHTGEALSSVLQHLRQSTPGRLFVVFGCGGNRDPARRIGMAQAADQYADVAIVTTDNPRTEDPKEIERQIVRAFQKITPQCEPDRKQAIAHALFQARPGDIVLIAGKGHEKTQIFANQTLPFDDVLVAKESLI
ncbi:MAG: UDP-N-acetylmuramoyl-L-alanyl-D-glutamate--2,6-diaminopimelate ligase [Chlamydiia bacterium]|nr:UDP-N-acetylmuramoyl-L-alanyl-D-glutamate--2,6-diaminopimelate ligase [Chlamydiia bacterium]